MVNKSKTLSSALFGIMIAAGAGIAVAASAGHGEEPITFMGDWLPRLVNFAIIAAVLIYFGRKPVRDFFASRTAEIEKSIRESKEARDRAQAALADMERKMKELEDETNRMIADAKTRGEKDKAALIEEGNRVVQDVRQQVQQGIEIEMQKAKASLATEASLLSLELAEGSLRSKINNQDHERIVKEYINKVGGRG